MKKEQPSETPPRNRGGRKTDRPVNRNRVYYLFVDQGDLEPEQVRQAVDQFKKKQQ
jgi:hypothetical protein